MKIALASLWRRRRSRRDSSEGSRPNPHGSRFDWLRSLVPVPIPA